MPITIVTATSSVERETALVAQIANQRYFEIAFRCVERAEALATMRSGGVDAVLSVGVASWFDFQCIEEAHRAEVRLFGLSADPIEGEMLEVAGFTVVRDLVHLRELLECTPGRAGGPDAEVPSGKVVAIWGPKGSPGRTTIAIELAAVVAQAEPRTLLVDADLYGGDAAQLLGVVEELPGIVSICRMGARGELRGQEWIGLLRRVPSGPVLLPGLLRAELWGHVSEFGWTQVLDAARRCFKTTVLDVGFCLEAAPPMQEAPGRNEVAIAGVESADRVVAVMRADPIGIRSFFWSFADHRELLDEERTAVIVNRVRPGEEAEVARYVRQHLGRPPLAFVPDRPDHVLNAIWQGRPVATSAPSSPVSEVMREVAAGLGAEVAPRGFLNRLAGRRVNV